MIKYLIMDDKITKRKHNYDDDEYQYKRPNLSESLTDNNDRITESSSSYEDIK